MVWLFLQMVKIQLYMKKMDELLQTKSNKQFLYVSLGINIHLLIFLDDDHYKRYFRGNILARIYF